MNKSRNLVLAAATALSCMASASAADFGIGVGLVNGGTIYLPFEVVPGYRLEPFLSVNFGSDGNGDDSGDYLSRTMGAGLFATQHATESTVLYAGARLGLTKQSYDSSSGSSQSEVRSSGYLFAPTIGFDYFLQKNISIGAEIALSHIRTKGTVVQRTNSSVAGPSIVQETSTERVSTATTSQVTLKYFFH